MMFVLKRLLSHCQVKQNALILAMLAFLCLSATDAISCQTAVNKPAMDAGGVVSDETGQDDVVARVADAAITVEAIERLVAKRFPNVSRSKNLSEAELLEFRRAAAWGLVRRELAMVRLTELGGPALRAKINRQLDKELRSVRKINPDAVLDSNSRQDLAWRLAWNEYLTKYLTTENLTAYFKANAWKYDGTKVLASQVFLPDGANAMRELQRLKEAIESGELSFQQAAKDHSIAPSADGGGRVGWIQYSGDLPVSVAEAALTGEFLKPLGPIRSSSGWHLVMVEEKRKGEKSFDEIEDLATVQRQAADYLFGRLVNAGLESATVTWIDTRLKPLSLEGIQP